MTLRMSLLLSEVANKIGSDVPVQIGAPIPYGELSRFETRQDLVEHLHEVTFALGTSYHRFCAERNAI